MAASRPLPSSHAPRRPGRSPAGDGALRIGPATPLHGRLALAFGGASVRREREPDFEVFSVQRSRPDEFRLALAHELLRDGDEGVVPLLERLGVFERMEEHPGELVRVREEPSSGRLVVQVVRKR